MQNLYFIITLMFVQISFGQNNLEQLLKKYNDNSIPYISVEELSMPTTNVILLDAREIEEYQMSHLKDAIYVGYTNFKIENVTSKLKNKNQAIVVYCSLGIRSETIAKKLKSAGYTNVKNLYGGIFEWKNRSFDIYKNTGTKTDSIHTFSKSWSKWSKKGIKYYPKQWF